MDNKQINLKLIHLENKINNINYNRKIKPNVVITIISELVAGMIVGSIIGYFIDNIFETKPICLILFFVIGFFASLLNIYKHLYQKY